MKLQIDAINEIFDDVEKNINDMSPHIDPAYTLKIAREQFSALEANQIKCRCKDCIFRMNNSEKNHPGHGYCLHDADDKIEMVLDDHYCGYGEPKQ
jgi:hypothetical protein